MMEHFVKLNQLVKSKHLVKVEHLIGLNKDLKNLDLGQLS